MSEEQKTCTSCKRDRKIIFTWTQETISTISETRLCSDCAKAFLTVAFQLSDLTRPCFERRLKGPTDAR